MALNIVFYYGSGVAAPKIVDASVEALESLGHNVSKLELNDIHEDTRGRLPDQTDLVFAIDHTGCFDQQFIETEMKYFSWFTDHPYYFLKGDENNPYHHSCVTDGSFGDALRRIGFDKVFDLPLAGDSKAFGLVEEQDGMTSDVCFVGSLQADPDGLIEKRKRESDELTNLVMDYMSKAIRTDLKLDFLDLTDLMKKNAKLDLFETLSLPQLGLLLLNLDKEVDGLWKKELVGLGERFDFSIYGNQAWEAIRGDCRFLGHVNYGAELSGVYSSSKINIIRHRPQLTHGVNQRVYDIPLSGGFFLCDHKSDLEKIFPQAHRDITYSSLEDLETKISHFLEHDDKRKEISDYCRKEILNHHTYDQRWQKFLNEIATTP